jgi:hypothetical protein
VNRRVQTAGIEAGRTDGPPDAIATASGNQMVAYEQATSIASPDQTDTKEADLASSRTVVTRASQGSLKLRYTPRQTPGKRLSTS